VPLGQPVWSFWWNLLMTGSGVAWSTAIEEASWIGPRLSAFGANRVDSVIPSGFPAYVRLLHPVWHRASAESVRAVRWGEVAAWSGIALERTGQFQDIALPRQAPTAPAPWNSQGPDTGTLPAGDAAVLVELLDQHGRATHRQQCWFCVWDGYGWDHTVSMTATSGGNAIPQGPMVLPDPIPQWVRTGPRVQLPNRQYLLFTGPIHAAMAFVNNEQQTANLWWPQHHGWCVASEIDLPWTYLGGPESLIETVLADPRLEAMPARPEDPIHFRLQGWLDTLVADATVELLERGTATLTTWRGSVHATLTRPTAVTAGWLQVSDGAGGGAGMAVTSESEDFLLNGGLRRYLGSVVADLVNTR
jgi:hypothetical protein